MPLRDIKPSVSDTRLHHGLHKSEFTPSGQKPEIWDVDQFGKPPSYLPYKSKGTAPGLFLKPGRKLTRLENVIIQCPTGA
ncbi:uncharacterized protein B0T23DRAFT_405735 [Neurospora hispaniola]|uniref:Uncharacterized protein n=1 Tax=Neurospora hispaniola TaxID=588809 RepID=A0AAJ0I662_9PEZI|nr:hypothetical protein B0T23DRAFT_405735 [Neurospora hispaniola]